MKSAIPKAFLPLLGHPLFVHTLRRFAACRKVGKVILVVPGREMDTCDRFIRADNRLEGLNYVLQAGGPRRQDSVRQGLSRLDTDCEVVLIHDGARPLVSPQLLGECAEVARSAGAVVVGTPARDTIKMVADNRVVYRTLSRDDLWHIQTPQAFRTELIRAAYDLAADDQAEATDDSMLVERLGRTVTVLEGTPMNFKITVPEDLLIAEILIQKNPPD